jgi:hypothetical protein
MAETPKPFLVVCICSLLCRDKGVELAEMPEPFFGVCVRGFCAALLPPRLPAMTFGIIAPIDLRPMAATGILPGDVVIALAFAAVAAAVAASMFVGGGDGVRDIVALLGESWV